MRKITKESIKAFYNRKPFKKSNMLVENKSNGLTLEESSNILLGNVDKLNASSNEAASSLEETAAALEQITSNIRSTTDNIA